MTAEQLALGFMLLWMESDRQRQICLKALGEQNEMLDGYRELVQTLNRAIDANESLIREMKLNIKADDERWKLAKELIAILKRRLAEKGIPTP